MIQLPGCTNPAHSGGFGHYCGTACTPPVENSNPSGASEGADGQGACIQKAAVVALYAAAVVSARRRAEAEPKGSYPRRYWQQVARANEELLVGYANCLLRGFTPAIARAMRRFEVTA